MIQIDTLKEKVTWRVLIVLVIYLGALIILCAVLLPIKSKNARLLADLEQLERTDKNLSGILKERPNLDREKDAVEERIVAMERLIPTQYDLPLVLERLEELANFNGLSIAELSHVPLKMEVDKTGVIPLSIEILGDKRLLAFLAHLQDVLPSLKLNRVSLVSEGNNVFKAAVQADLKTLVVDKASDSNFRLGELKQNELDQESFAGFGLPFEAVAQFLGKAVKVLGVVESGGTTRALILKDGVKRWIAVGEKLDGAMINGIFANGVILDVDGVLINLRIGG